MSATADRDITVPAMYAGQSDAELNVYTADGETVAMELVHEGKVIARGEGFRAPAAGTWTWLDCPDAKVLGTFGSFLSHALESSEDGARDGWEFPHGQITAGAWSDACVLAAENE